MMKVKILIMAIKIIITTNTTITTCINNSNNNRDTSNKNVYFISLIIIVYYHQIRHDNSQLHYEYLQDNHRYHDQIYDNKDHYFHHQYH